MTKTSKNKTGSSQVGFFFDQTRCDACYSCVVACKDWHDVPAGPASWLKVSTIEKGKFPNPFLAFMVQSCRHCLNASCVSACPAEAISKREEDGIVVVDREKCVGRDECGRTCSADCPIGNDTLGFISLIKEGKYAEAWRLLSETNPFPGVCGRICSHPCESACNRSQVDEAVAIHSLERFASDWMPALPPFRMDWKKQKVAIVGSGPAGLSCAYQLARLGYRVTVFEALPVEGGMLRVGIPEFRLPKAVVERDIAFIKALGVEIRTNTRVGVDLSIEELDKFDAVFMAVGTHKAKLLKIPGTDMKDVMPAIEFLKKVKLNEKVNVGKRVIVLGGGSVAFDCAFTAYRLGANEVSLLCPECHEDMPADPLDLKLGAEEGVNIYASCLASRILGKNGRVSGVEYVKLRSMSFDQDGKLHFDVIEGSKTELPADTVILALGQDADLSFLPKDITVKRGMIHIDENGATSRRKYFAGGDAAISEKKVAWAIGSGRTAAQTIDRLLKGLPEVKQTRKFAIKPKLTDTDFIEKKERVVTRVLSASDRRKSFAEIEASLDSSQAKIEANRCLICRSMCSVACPYDAPQFSEEDNPKMQKCDLCVEEWEQGKQPLCVRSCTMRALDVGLIEELRAKYGDIKEAEGFTYHKKSEPAITFKPKTHRTRLLKKKV